MKRDRDIEKSILQFINSHPDVWVSGQLLEKRFGSTAEVAKALFYLLDRKYIAREERGCFMTPFHLVYRVTADGEDWMDVT